MTVLSSGRVTQSRWHNLINTQRTHAVIRYTQYFLFFFRFIFPLDFFQLLLCVVSRFWLLYFLIGVTNLVTEVYLHTLWALDTVSTLIYTLVFFFSSSSIVRLVKYCWLSVRWPRRWGKSGKKISPTVHFVLFFFSWSSITSLSLCFIHPLIQDRVFALKIMNFLVLRGVLFSGLF